MNLSVVILAAGLGTRMKSATPKVLHALYGKPLLRYVIDAVGPLKPSRTVIVVGPDHRGVKPSLADVNVSLAVQRTPLGTGDAVKAALPRLPKDGTVLVLNGDTPLIETSTLKELLKRHRQKRESVSVLTFRAEGAHSYGRIVREGASVAGIVEDRDASAEQKGITEVNSGVYAFDVPALGLLKALPMNISKGEYYLTDIVSLAVAGGRRVGAHLLASETELTGINTRAELSRAGRYLRDRIVARWLDAGVSFVDPSAVFIDPAATIGPDTLIYPNVYLEGATSVGAGSTIYPGTRIVDGIIGDNVTIKDSTVIEASTVRDHATVGPFAHLRPGSVIGEKAKIGNFVEIKKSVIGTGAKASHLSYLGDAEVGEAANIGAGTITCNYDGVNKHRTIIGRGVFVGSDTQLVAPVRIGDGAYIAAGSTVTHDVPPDSLALSRTRQKNIPEWALRNSPFARKRRGKGKHAK